MLYQLNEPIGVSETSSTWSSPISVTSSTSSDLTDLEGWSSGGGSDREGHRDGDAQQRHRRRHGDHPHPPTSGESERSTEEENQSTPPTSTGSQPGDAKNQKVETADISGEGNQPDSGMESSSTVPKGQIEDGIETATQIPPHAVAERGNGVNKVVTSQKREPKDNIKESVQIINPKKTSPRPAVGDSQGRNDEPPERKNERSSPNKIVKRKRRPRTKEEKLAHLDAQVEKVQNGTHPIFIQRTASAKIIYESKTRQNNRQLSYSLQSYKDLEDMAKRAGRQWLEAKQLETRQKLIEQVKSMLRKLEADWQTENLNNDAEPEFPTLQRQAQHQTDYRQVRRQNRENARVAISQIHSVTGYREGACVKYEEEIREAKMKCRKRGYEEVELEREGEETEEAANNDRRRSRRRRTCRVIGRIRAVQVSGCSPMEAEEDLALMGCN